MEERRLVGVQSTSVAKRCRTADNEINALVVLTKKETQNKLHPCDVTTQLHCEWLRKTDKRENNY